MKRRMLCLAMGMVMLGQVLTGCGDSGTEQKETEEKTKTTETAEKPEDDISQEITVWTRLSQQEIDNYIEDFNEVNPNIKVNAVVFPQDSYTTKLEAALRSGTGAPDVFTTEFSELGKFKDSEYLENLSGSPYKADELMDDFVPYVAELCKDSSGNVKGLSYQSCPGGFWYYKPLAKEYLGTDDPDELHEMLKDWDSITEVGKSVYEKSQGDVYLLDSVSSVKSAYIGTRTSAYVEDGKMMDPSFFEEMMEISKRVRDNHGDAMLEVWGAAWASGFYGENKFIMCGLPSWGLHYAIKANTPGDAADTDDTWGFFEAPASFWGGGTWLNMYSGSKNKEAAWEFIRTITADEEYLMKYVESTGDMVSYIPAIKKVIESGFRDPFTGDQDIYQYMYDAAMNIEPIALTKYDLVIENGLTDKQELAVAGEMTIEEAVEAVMKDVQTQFPEVTVE